MKRPKTDDTLCFVCQKDKPTKIATKDDREIFLLCNVCATIVKQENNINNRVKMALVYPENGTKIFTEILGGGQALQHIDIRFSPINETKTTAGDIPTSSHSS